MLGKYSTNLAASIGSNSNLLLLPFPPHNTHLSFTSFLLAGFSAYHSCSSESVFSPFEHSPSVVLTWKNIMPVSTMLSVLWLYTYKERLLEQNNFVDLNYCSVSNNFKLI